MPLLLPGSGSERRPEDSSSGSDDEASQPSLPSACREQGSVDFPYKLLVVGGGPAGFSIMIRALRLGLLTDLCEASKTHAGVCLLEAGTADRIGGGRLQDYLINSNTFANKFYSGVMDCQPTNLPPESVAGTCLARLGGAASRSGAALREEKAGKEAPLALVGAWLRDVSAELAETVQQFFPASSCCRAGVHVSQIQRCRRPKSTSSKGLLPASPCAAAPEAETELLWRVSWRDANGASLEYYAQNVSLATGGRQELPVLPSAVHTAKLIASDRVCTAEGIEEVRRRMHHAPRRQQRIVIVGGSHSAFSAAWMCLNKLGIHSNNNAVDAAPAAAGEAGDVSGNFGASSICILHRSPIRVFYASKREAEADGNDYIGTVHRSTGQVHPFGGLRADAKELWQRVRRGKEPRLRLVKATAQQSIALKLFDEAAVIIWACGYSTNVVDVLDEAGLRMPLRIFRGQVEVDDQARLLLDAPPAMPPPTSSAKGAQQLQQQQQQQPPALPVGNLFGIGLGYGLKATVDGDREELDGSSGRADGVAVYLKRGATLILGAVLGPRVFGMQGERQLMSWEERAVALNKRGGDDDGDGPGSPTNGPSSPLTPPRSSASPALLPASSPILRRVASASTSGGAAARGGSSSSSSSSSSTDQSKALCFPPLLARSSTASAKGTRRAPRGIGPASHESKRALVGELLGALKRETIFLEPNRMAASVDRLSKPRSSHCVNFAAPAKPKVSAAATVAVSSMFSPLAARKNAPALPFVALKPAPLVLPGLAKA